MLIMYFFAEKGKRGMDKSPAIAPEYSPFSGRYLSSDGAAILLRFEVHHRPKGLKHPFVRPNLTNTLSALVHHDRGLAK